MCIRDSARKEGKRIARREREESRKGWRIEDGERGRGRNECDEEPSLCFAPLSQNSRSAIITDDQMLYTKSATYDGRIWFVNTCGMMTKPENVCPLYHESLRVTTWSS